MAARASPMSPPRPSLEDRFTPERGGGVRGEADEKPKKLSSDEERLLDELVERFARRLESGALRLRLGRSDLVTPRT